MSTRTPSQLTAVLAGDVDDTAVMVIDDNDGATRKITIAQLRTAMGTITLTGDVTGSGAIGSIALTIANASVSLAKMANMATNKLLGRSTAGPGAPEVISIGSGLTLSAGVLSASAPAGAAPSATLLTHRTFGGL